MNTKCQAKHRKQKGNQNHRIIKFKPTNNELITNRTHKINSRISNVKKITYLNIKLV